MQRARRLRASLGIKIGLGLAAVLLGSCAPRRILVVDSEPRGALVRLDDRTIGETRVEHPFYHYGIRQVTLYEAGCQTHSERIELETPWYSRFPLDFVSEVLLPFGWKDRRKLKVELVPGEEEVSLPTLRSVFERADILRKAGSDGPRNLPPPRVRPLLRNPVDDATHATDGT